MKEETKSLYIALFASILIIFGVNHFFPAEKPVTEIEKVNEQPEIVNVEHQPDNIQSTKITAKEAVSLEKNITVENQNIKGNIRLRGARFDYLLLKKYKQTLEQNSDDVELLAPSSTISPYFADFGWLSSNNNIKMPDSNTIWNVIGEKLTPDTPVTLEWDNGDGLKFIRIISVDDNYMFNIVQTVENKTQNPVVLYPYVLISRKIDMQAQKRSVVHEGFSGVINGSLEELKYSKLDEKENKTFETKNGWFGFSDRYWFTAMILSDNENATVKISRNEKDIFQTDYRGAPITIASGSAATNTVKFYAGAKEIKLLDKYTNDNHIEKFDLAVDFGWYYFLTKPFFYILTFLYQFIGNMGWAILLFAALLRLVMFPIANASYESMTKMKKVQPKVMALQQLYKNDKMRLQQETME
ncbi:MAG: membrane protein insertase YidC, partial [Alphaproteobacteria bacterium]|nr:membrane protein insertase YidC [Alphaproteobacteria bacterium]